MLVKLGCGRPSVVESTGTGCTREGADSVALGSVLRILALRVAVRTLHLVGSEQRYGVVLV